MAEASARATTSRGGASSAITPPGRAARVTICPVCDAALHPERSTARDDDPASSAVNQPTADASARTGRPRRRPPRGATAIAWEPQGPAQCPECGAALQPVFVASTWRRISACVVDGLALLLTVGPLYLAVLALVRPPAIATAANGLLPFVLEWLAADLGVMARRAAPVLVMAALYFGLFWALSGQTPGQRLLGLRVVGPAASPPGLVRTLARLVGAGVGALLGGLGWWWAAFDDERRALHDHLAGTWVVRSA